MKKAALPVFGPEFVQQLGCKLPLSGTQRVRVPLRGVAVVNAYKGRLTPHGQAHITAQELLIDLLAQLVNTLPLLIRVGLGHAGRLIDARHTHLMAELNLCLIDKPRNRSSTRGHGCAGKGDVSLPRQESRGRV